VAIWVHVVVLWSDADGEGAGVTSQSETERRCCAIAVSCTVFRSYTAPTTSVKSYRLNRYCCTRFVAFYAIEELPLAHTDDVVRCWRSKVRDMPWFMYVVVKASKSTLGRRCPSSSISFQLQVAVDCWLLCQIRQQ